jgi:hypothetical protein
VSSIAQGNHRCAPAPGFGGCVVVGDHPRIASKDRSHDFSLYADAAPMNDSECPETQPVSFSQVLFHNRLDLSGRHAVQIENIGYRNPDRLLFGFHTTPK